MADNQGLELRQRHVLLRMKYSFQSNVRQTVLELVLGEHDGREIALEFTRSWEDAVQATTKFLQVLETSNVVYGSQVSKDDSKAGSSDNTATKACYFYSTASLSMFVRRAAICSRCSRTKLQNSMFSSTASYEKTQKAADYQAQPHSSSSPARIISMRAAASTKRLETSSKKEVSSVCEILSSFCISKDP